MPLDNRSQLKVITKLQILYVISYYTYNFNNFQFCKPINELPDCTKTPGKSITIIKSKEDNNVQINSTVTCNCPHHTKWVLTNHEQINKQNEANDIRYVKDEFKCKKVNNSYLLIIIYLNMLT